MDNNEILTPEINKKINELTGYVKEKNKYISAIEKAENDIVFVDGAVIIGHDFEKYCDKFAVVICDRAKQYESGCLRLR